MKKSTKLLVYPLTFVLISCGNGPVDSSISSSVSSSSSRPEPVTLAEAIENTTSYCLYDNYGVDYQGDYRSYFEINSPTEYICFTQAAGYAVLDSDPSFSHVFSVTQSAEEDKTVLNMMGRVGDKSVLTNYCENTTSFIEMLDEYQYMFHCSGSDRWRYYVTGTGLARPFYQFFQRKAFSYCNYFEIEIGDTGKVSKFKAGEYSKDDLSDLYITEEFVLQEASLKDTYLYKDWVAKGSPIDVRIYNLKSYYQDRFLIKPCYSDASITATVTAVDYDGSYYIANLDSLFGHIGMRVVPSDSSTYNPVVGDIIDVRGSLSVISNTNSKNAFSPMIVEANATKTGVANVIPSFNEETLVDSYGGGIYAAYYLSADPLFSHSSYSGYGYPINIPALPNEEGDTVVDILCPAWKYESGYTLTMKLHLPKEYGVAKNTAILDELRSLGDYSVSPATAKLAYFGNVISYFSFAGISTNEPSVDLYAMANSTISHRLGFQESIKAEYGIDDFPELEVGSNKITFHFGDLTGFHLESFYNMEGTFANGIFYTADSLTEEDVKTYLENVVSVTGATFVDIYSPGISSTYQHHVYQLGDIYIDACVMTVDDECTLYLFVYRSDKMIRQESMEETIDRTFESFTSEDFVKLPGTYDRDYHLYSLDNYAGHRFEDGKLLNILTLDITENRYQELRDAYRAKGWKQWRVDNSDPYSQAYTYITRGVSHVVYYRDNGKGAYTFLDFASYPTGDYTFVNHKAFDPRIEIAIYDGDAPLATEYTKNMTQFIDDSVTDGFGRFDWTLPEDYKAEIYYTRSSKLDVLIEYGYTFSSNAFIYPNKKADLDACHQYVLDTLTSNGYSFGYDGKKGSCYYKQGTGFQAQYFYVMKDSRGFVRIIGGIGGVDF